jgi:hypothetical protein
MELNLTSSLACSNSIGIVDELAERKTARLAGNQSTILVFSSVGNSGDKESRSTFSITSRKK